MAGAIGRESPQALGRARRAALVVGATGVLLVCGLLSELAVADFVQDSNPHASVAQRVMAVLNNGDRLHYSVHLAAGRVLDLCPCTEQRAATQYWRAGFHATAEWQVDLLTDERPTTPADRAADTIDLAARGLGWSVAELGKLSAQLPPR